LVTTEPAQHSLSYQIPGHITVLPPIQQSSPMVIGKAFSWFFSVLHLWMCGGIQLYIGCKNTLEPIVTVHHLKPHSLHWNTHSRHT
jgi:hypothetical protein